jgi:putative transposase
MPASFICFAALQHGCRAATVILLDLGQFALLSAHSRNTLAAENLFLRKQLALFQERKARPRRADDATRWIMATLSRLFPWRAVRW